MDIILAVSSVGDERVVAYPQVDGSIKYTREEKYSSLGGATYWSIRDYSNAEWIAVKWIIDGELHTAKDYPQEILPHDAEGICALNDDSTVRIRVECGKYELEHINSEGDWVSNMYVYDNSLWVTTKWITEMGLKTAKDYPTLAELGAINSREKNSEESEKSEENSRFDLLDIQTNAVEEE